MGDMASAVRDPATLERVAQEFRREIWTSVTADAVSEAGIEARSFGPVQATAFRDLPEEARLNQVLGAAEPGAVEEGHLARAIEWMRLQEVHYRVPVAESRPEAAAAEQWLGQRGYERGAGSVKLVRDTSEPSWPRNLAIRVYSLGAEEADGEGLCEMITETFGLPLGAGTLFFALPQMANWRCYTAGFGRHGPIVATASMMVCAGVAQLGLSATLPEARGKGCGWELLRRRLSDAARAGCHTVFTELGEFEQGPTEARRRRLEAAGFREAHASRNWQRPVLPRKPPPYEPYLRNLN